MRRAGVALRHDIRLQWRYGFYYAAVFVTLVWLLIVSQIPGEARAWAMPLVIFTDLGIIGLYFVAGALLLERGDRTVHALVLTPLRFWEYIGAKLASLTLLALAASLVVALLGYGPGFQPVFFGLGVMLKSLITLLTGVIAVAPFRSISDFIVPSQFVLIPLALPLLEYFGWVSTPLMYLAPTQGSLLLLAGAFGSLEPWQVVYAVVYQAVVVGALLLLARRAFDRVLLRREGARP